MLKKLDIDSLGYIGKWQGSRIHVFFFSSFEREDILYMTFLYRISYGPWVYFYLRIL